MKVQRIHSTGHAPSRPDKLIITAEEILQWQNGFKYFLKLHSYYFHALLFSRCFIYILDSSNSSSITFWTSMFGSSSRCNWTGTWTSNSNGSWTDKQSSHFSTAKEIILFHVTITTNKFWNDAGMMLKSFWTSHLQMMNALEPQF